MTIHNFGHLDLNLLRVFDEVMVERNLTKAGLRLSMTQPAVSNALKRLRVSLGDELFRRNGFGMEPTAFAQAVWPTVRDALQQLRETLTPGAFDPRNDEHTFVLTMADVTATMLMPSLMPWLTAEAPRVNIRVQPLTNRDPRQALQSGSVELAIGHFPGVMAELTANHLQEAKSRFSHQRLYESRYVVAMRHNHPLAGQAIALDDYCTAQHLLVNFSGRAQGYVDEALAQMGRERRVILTVNQFFTAARVVANTDMITTLPRHFLQASGMAEALWITELPLPVPPVVVDALWNKNLDAQAAHQWLRNAVLQASARSMAEV
jgi:DNA-binding transcriptional LysR family regulator